MAGIRLGGETLIGLACVDSAFLFGETLSIFPVIYDGLNQSPGGLKMVGFLVGAGLVLAHGMAWAGGKAVREWLKRFPFEERMGWILMGVAGLWCHVLFSGLSLGPLRVPKMDMGEFYHLRPVLQWGSLAAAGLVAVYCKEFLSVRALGCVVLLAMAVPLDAAFLKVPLSRLLMVAWAYAGIGFALFWIGMPYTLRDQIAWVTRDPRVWNGLCAAGVAYGVLILAAAWFWW